MKPQSISSSNKKRFRSVDKTVKNPNPVICDYSVDHITNAFAVAVEHDIADKLRKGFPVARYDVNKKQAYLETADGKREYVNE